jgi:hypothetical protein
VEHVVELLGRLEVTPEGLLDDDARVLGAARRPETLDDLLEHAGRDGEVVRGTVAARELLLEPAVGRLLVVVAVDVSQQRRELLVGVLVVAPAGLLREAVVGTLAQVVDRPLTTTPMTGRQTPFFTIA